MSEREATLRDQLADLSDMFAMGDISRDEFLKRAADILHDHNAAFYHASLIQGCAECQQ